MESLVNLEVVSLEEIARRFFFAPLGREPAGLAVRQPKCYCASGHSKNASNPQHKASPMAFHLLAAACIQLILANPI